MQAEEFYRALRLRKVPTKMVRLTDASHDHSSIPSNFLRVRLYLRNWYERFMVKGGRAGADSREAPAWRLEDRSDPSLSPRLAAGFSLGNNVPPPSST